MCSDVSDCICGVVYDCECGPLDNYEDMSNRWIQIRFPHVLLKREADGSRCVAPMSVGSHYPLVRFERENETLDW